MSSSGDDGRRVAGGVRASPRPRAWLGWAALLLAVGGVAVLVGRAVGWEDVASLATTLRAFGDRWWAPLALIAAFVVVNLTGLPGTPLTLAAGAVWGWLVGGAWVMLAILLGTAVPYLIARSGSPRVRRVLEARFGVSRRRLQRHGLRALLILRALHVIPFAVLSYAAGLAGMRPRDYFLATFLGTLPGVLVYTYLADALLAGAISGREAAGRVVLAGALVVGLALLSLLARRRLQH
jgi:uncharacterized membrane protein YdjX (TVP38/TMEM64 family)